MIPIASHAKGPGPQMQRTAVVNQKRGVGKTTTTISIGRALARPDQPGRRDHQHRRRGHRHHARQRGHGAAQQRSRRRRSRAGDPAVQSAGCRHRRLRRHPHRLPPESEPADRQRPRRRAPSPDHHRPELYSGRGVGKLLDTIDSVRERLNPLLTVAGVLINKHDKNERIHVRRAIEIREQLTAGDPPVLVMPTMVPRWTTVMRTTDANADVADFNHPAARKLLGFYQTIARVLDPSVPAPDMHAALEEVSLVTSYTPCAMPPRCRPWPARTPSRLHSTNSRSNAPRSSCTRHPRPPSSSSSSPPTRPTTRQETSWCASPQGNRRRPSRRHVSIRLSRGHPRW